jgi:hypothetical protein
MELRTKLGGGLFSKMSSPDGLSGGLDSDAPDEENSKRQGHSGHNSSRSKRSEFSDNSREFPVHKYSNKGKGPLCEAIILDGKPFFIKHENSEIKLIETIEEASRIIRPPVPKEYPYEPYEFRDKTEIEYYTKQAKERTVDALFNKSKCLVLRFIDQDEYIINLLVADIIWTYFQDRFSTTPYLGVIGDNGSGKSTVGDTFEAIAYRPVNLTDPTAANLFRVMGTIEPGQCILIEDS